MSGCTDYFAETEMEGLDIGRDIMATLNYHEHLKRHKTPADPLIDPECIAALIGNDNKINIKKVHVDTHHSPVGGIFTL